MTRKTVNSCREILSSAEREVERLRNHAGARNRTIDRVVVGLTELRASLAKRAAK